MVIYCQDGKIKFNFNKMTRYEEFVIENEYAGNRRLIGYNPEVYEEIRRQLQDQATLYKQQAAVNQVQKSRLDRLEALANALHEELEQKKNGSIGFLFKDVVDRILSGHLIDTKNKNSLEHKTINENIRAVINLIIIQEDQPKGGTGLRRFNVAYNATSNSKYGYLMPKH